MSDRAQRPPIERTRPNRTPNDILRGLGARVPGTTGPLDAEDPITRSVGAGYRIVEQYLEQSRSAAAGFAPSPGAGGANAITDLTSRMVRTTADLFEVWFQLIDLTGAARGTAATEGAARNHRDSVDTAAPAEAAEGGPSRPAGVIVELRSSRPATVRIDVHTPENSGRLVAHALRSDSEELPRISTVSLEAEQGGAPPKVSISIPDEQPAGVYNGMIIDTETSVPVGTISVRVGSGD